MFNQLDWNPAYSIETLEPNTVFFLSERESICFQEPLYYRLVRLIDGQRNLDEIIDKHRNPEIWKTKNNCWELVNKI